MDLNTLKENTKGNDEKLEDKMLPTEVFLV
jgi:hypothetical protein